MQHAEPQLQPTVTCPAAQTSDAPSRRSVMAVCAVATLGAAGLAACGSSSSSTTPSASDTGSAGTSASSSGGSAQAPLAKLADVPVGGAISATAPAGPVIIARKSETEVVGFSAKCTHAGTTVNPKGKELDCPQHGSRFDALTGAVLNGPATSPLNPFPVKIDGANVVAG